MSHTLFLPSHILQTLQPFKRVYSTTATIKYKSFKQIQGPKRDIIDVIKQMFLKRKIMMRKIMNYLHI